MKKTNYTDTMSEKTKAEYLSSMKDSEPPRVIVNEKKKKIKKIKKNS